MRERPDLATAERELEAVDGVVAAVAMDPVLVGYDVRWQISGPDLLIESDTGLSVSDAELWKRLVTGAETVPGLRRTQVGLRIEGDKPRAPVRVANLELHTDGRALAAARGATRQLNRLSRQLALGADPVELWVNVAGPDDAVEQSFPLSGASSWSSFNLNA
ncbi:MAG: hypothetical protein WKF79_12495 [Nocardioides sp.]